MFFHQVSNTKGDVYNAFIYHNGQWKPHFHKAYEWIYQIAGPNRVSIGNTEYLLNPGDCLLIPPYGLHAIQSEAENDCFILVFSAQYAPHAAKLFSENEPSDYKMHLSEECETYLLKKLIGPIPDAQSMHPVKKPDLFTIKSCLYAIFSEFLAQNPLRLKNNNDDIMERLLSYIERNYTSNITLSQAAADLGYNYDYLSRIFNQTYHMNFKTTVNQYRCEKALQLLTTTKQSLTDISLASGFQSIRSFNRIFKEVMGMAPSDFRHGQPSAYRGQTP